MKKDFLLIALFMLVVTIVFYLSYQVILPFLAPICWAAVFTILFSPLYERIRVRLRSPRLASIIMCLLIVLIIVGPVTYLFVALVGEAGTALTKVNSMYKSGELDQLVAIRLPWLEAAQVKLSEYFDLSQIDLKEIVRTSMERVSRILFSQTSWIIANGAKAIFYFAVMVFTMFYFFKDGRTLVHRIKRLLPLTREQIEETFDQLYDVIQATMAGGLIVALVQGLLGTILFAAVGIPSAIFWGAVMAFLSIIPFVGAFIVYVPAGIILIIGGSPLEGLIVLTAGTVVISQIDNVIRPYLISGRTSMHPLLLFFAIMGGMVMFGLLGVILGPLIAAIFETLLKIFEFKLHPDDETDIGAATPTAD